MFVSLICFYAVFAVHDISKFGAVPSLGIKQPDVSIAIKNAEAIQQAFQAANEDINGDRTVLVPNKQFYFTGDCNKLLRLPVYEKIVVLKSYSAERD